ncbi:MAG: type I-E CRISPR-associated protein Cas6/Cse3/CasE [Planctomycetota bacterium]|nr:type I-E CRISPR-associated protein Cas6/Cse3/CasE [Planctomycetota bacterium]
MYLSTLLIDVGQNPDRPRPGRLWLRNLYRVHQRLCMAFPSKDRATADPAFLKPYNPAHFPEDRVLADKKPGEVEPDTLQHIHARRDQSSGFLFRVDPQPGGNVVIVVLSALEPDWDYAFGLKKDALDANGRPVGNAGYLLAAPPQKPRALQLKIEPGEQFRFRLLAHPTKRPPMSKEQWQEKKAAGEHIKRPRLQLTWKPDEDPAQVFKGWLEERGTNAGFKLRQVDVSQLGYVYFNKGGIGAEGRRLRSVRYEGVLEVTDPPRFLAALTSGIGPAKAFGFGLLSIASAG